MPHIKRAVEGAKIGNSPRTKRILPNPRACEKDFKGSDSIEQAVTDIETENDLQGDLHRSSANTLLRTRQELMPGKGKGELSVLECAETETPTWRSRTTSRAYQDGDCARIIPTLPGKLD